MTDEQTEIPHTILGFTKYLLSEIVRQKKWLLLPVWILLAACALAIAFGGASTILPAIYIAF